MSAIHPKADIAECDCDVRFVPMPEVEKNIRIPVSAAADA
jgi:hypothetical protein